MNTLRLLDTELTPLCAPSIAAGLSEPADLARITLLRSFRGQDWLTWLKAAGVDHIALTGPIFDSSFLMAEAAARGYGIAILPAALFAQDIASGRLVQPFALAILTDAYWLVTPKGREPSSALAAFVTWIAREVELAG
jgi:LysR family transcriptional regulator, regulator of gene expression of beta-lactamase